MGSIGSLLGTSPNTGAGGSGTNYVAGSTNLIDPNNGQANQRLDTSYSQNQDALKQQQAFLTALQAQNGIGNQSSVYNQFQGIANGTGPNPAQAMLNQSTAQNVANQAAMMAGQRGAGANIGLLARQAAQQGAATQQQAVGQGATLQAQQAMSALGQMSGVAGQQVANQSAATTGLTQAQQNEQQNLLNSTAQYNNANVAQQGSQNSANAGLANTVAGGQMKTQSGIMNGISSIAGMLAHGGEVKSPEHYAMGTQPGLGVSTDLGVSAPAYPSNEPQSFHGRSMGGLQSNAPSNRSGDAAGTPSAPPPISSAPQMSAEERMGTNIGSALAKGASKLGGLFKGAKSNPVSAPSDQDMSGGYANQSAFQTASPSDQDMSGGYSNQADYQAGEPSAADMSGGFSADPTTATDAPAMQGATDAAAGAEDASELADVGEVAEVLARGGKVKKMAAGGDTDDLMGNVAKLAPLAMMLMARGGMVDALLSPGELYLSPDKAKKVANSKDKGKAVKKEAKHIPGKAKVKGDSLKNDIVPAKLEEGGIVIPRSIVQSKNAPERCAAFVSAHLAKHGMGMKRG